MDIRYNEDNQAIELVEKLDEQNLLADVVSAHGEFEAIEPIYKDAKRQLDTAKNKLAAFRAVQAQVDARNDAPVATPTPEPEPTPPPAPQPEPTPDPTPAASTVPAVTEVAAPPVVPANNPIAQILSAPPMPAAPIVPVQAVVSPIPAMPVPNGVTPLTQMPTFETMQPVPVNPNSPNAQAAPGQM